MIKKLQALKAKKGFTLVELVVVIAIIGVLAAILVPTMLGVVEDSRITSANQLATNIKNRVTEFFGKMDSIKASYIGGKATLIIEANNGSWKITATPDDAKKTDLWLDKGNHFGTAADANAETIKNKDTELIAYIADTTSDMKSCYAKVYIGANSKVIGVAAVEGTNTAPSTIPADTNFTSGKWNGWNGKAGVITGNIIIGTAPVLASGS